MAHTQATMHYRLHMYMHTYSIIYVATYVSMHFVPNTCISGCMYYRVAFIFDIYASKTINISQCAIILSDKHATVLLSFGLTHMYMLKVNLHH